MVFMTCLQDTKLYPKPVIRENRSADLLLVNASLVAVAQIGTHPDGYCPPLFSHAFVHLHGGVHMAQ